MPEFLNGGAALGLRLTTKDNSREKKLPAESDKVTRKEFGC